MSILREILSALRDCGTRFETYDRHGECVRSLASRDFLTAIFAHREALRGWTQTSYGGHKVLGLLFKPEESVEFLVATFAALAEGFTVVPLYPNWSADVQLRHLREYRIRAIALGEGFSERASSWSDQLDHVVSISLDGDFGASVEASQLDEHLAEDYCAHLPDDHPSAWIFTSGTSGEIPKCTVISLRNLQAAIENIKGVDFIHEGMTVHSPLSTSHIFAFAVVLGILATRPRRILFSDVQYLARLPQEKIGKIDGVILVPLVLNRMRAAFYEKLVTSGERCEPRLARVPLGLRRFLKGCLQRAEDSVVAVESGRVRGLVDWPAMVLCRSLFSGEILRRLGSPQFVVVGGARPSLKSMAFLNVMGIRCLQGWGMTETTGALSVCELGDRFRGAFGTCGSVFSDTAAYLEGGELVVEGPQVAEGYMQPDGTFVPFNGVKRTGDFAEFDSRGRLRVLGKVSDRITLANGLNYNPVIFEELLLSLDLKERHLLEDAVVIGDGQPRLGCVFFPREPLDTDEDPEGLRPYLETLLKDFNLTRSVDEQVGPWTIHPESIRETGFLGPSGKLCRRHVEESFAHLFEDRRLEKVSRT